MFIDESLNYILAADLEPEGAIVALTTLAAVRRFGSFDEFILSTGDHGITLEFTYHSRELIIVIPCDGSRMYFTAKDNDFREAGITFTSGLQGLAAWLADKAEFPVTGLVKG